MDEREPVMTTKDVATRLQVSTATVSRLAKAGKLPVVRLGHRTLRYRHADVDRLLAEATSHV